MPDQRFLLPGAVLQVLHAVAEKHRVTVSAVAARWVLQQPQVAAIILGARNALHYRVSCSARGWGGGLHHAPQGELLQGHGLIPAG
jgi:aryl-alcohol dehydrogenase-like predicted oxidoreductase